MSEATGSFQENSGGAVPEASVATALAARRQPEPIASAGNAADNGNSEDEEFMHAKEEEDVNHGEFDEEGEEEEGKGADDEGKAEAWWKKASKKEKKLDSGRQNRLERAKVAVLLWDNKALPAGLEPPSKEEAKDLPHTLKSFYMWMMRGTSFKSAPSYCNHVKLLIRDHRISIAAANSAEYIAHVKSSKENMIANGIYSASVRQFQMWLAERGSTTGPWEEQASCSDKLFDPRFSGGRKPLVPVDPVQSIGSALKNLFSAKPKSSTEPESTPCKVFPENKIDHQVTPLKQAPPPMKKAGRPSKAAPAPAESLEPAAKRSCGRQKKIAPPTGNPVSAAAKATAKGFAFRKAAGKAKAKAKAKAKGKDKTKANAGVGGARKVIKSIDKVSRKEKANASKDIQPGTPAKEKAGRKQRDGDSTLTSPAKDCGIAKKEKKELGLQQQLAELMKLARGHVRKRDFQNAERVSKIILQHCEDNSIERPTALNEEAKKKETPEEVPKEDFLGADEAPKGDELEVARDVCRRCFNMKNPRENPREEDDEDVVPAVKKVVGNRKKEVASATAEDDDDVAVNGAGMNEDTAEKLAAVPEAEPSDYVQLNAVATTFQSHLVAGGFDEAKAEDYKKGFFELFQLDDKSFAGMATSEYSNLAASEDRRHGMVARAFAQFWSARGGEQFQDMQPRLPTSEERNLAAEGGVPPDWRVQVFHRTKREDLIVLTAPDGTHECTTKAGLKNMSALDEEFTIQKREAEEQGCRAEEARAAAAASLARRRLFNEERRRFVAEGAVERQSACARFESAFEKICAGMVKDGASLQGGLPADCLGTYIRVEDFEGRAAYERLNTQGVRRTFLFYASHRWMVAGALEKAAAAYAYVEDSANHPFQVDRDGSVWMVPGSAEEGGGFVEVRSNPAWCVELTGEALLQRAFKVLRRRRECCPGCGVHPAGEQNLREEPDDIEGKAQRLKWESYEDVPDATPEERGIYSAILQKFHQEGYPYLTGVRKIMARYLKSPAAMATKEFHVLVRNDPMNAVCNGYDSSAVLYFIMFWEKYGSATWVPLQKKNAREIELMENKERQAYLRDWARFDVEGREAYEIKEQAAVLTDLQIDMPLVKLIVDVTNDWKKDLTEFLSADGYLESDADAAGLMATKCGADLLPEPIAQEWESWPGVLKAFDQWKLGGKGGLEKKNHNKHTEPLQQVVRLHGKSPSVVATERYATIVTQHLGRDHPSATAVSLFQEFWKEREGTKMPDPSKGLLFGARLPARWVVPPLAELQETMRMRRVLQLPATWELQLDPFQAVEPADEGGRAFYDEASLREELQRQLQERQNEQRRKDAVAQEWSLPPRYEVEFEEDGTPYVMSPDGDIRYNNPEDVPRPTWMHDDDKEKKRTPKAPRSSLSGPRKSLAPNYERDMCAAAMRFDFAEVWRIQVEKERAKIAPPPVEKQVVKKTEDSQEKVDKEGSVSATEQTEEASGDVAMTDAVDPEAGEEQLLNDRTAAEMAREKGGGLPTGKTPPPRAIKCESRCRAGKMPIVRQTEQSGEKLARKYTKQAGLRQLQEKQIQTGELYLQAHCWRLVGVRAKDGGMVSLEESREKDPTKVTCVLAQIASDIVASEQERVRTQWGLDETWQVLVRTRLSGNQVTVRSPEGRSFFKRTQLDASRRTEGKRLAQIDEAAALEELLQILRTSTERDSPVFEVTGAVGNAIELNGVYRQCIDALPNVRFQKCCKAMAARGQPVEVLSDGGRWQFNLSASLLAVATGAPNPYSPESSLAPASGIDLADLARCSVRLLSPNEVMSRVVGSLSNQTPLKTCRFCTMGVDRNQGKKHGMSFNQRGEFEARLRDLGERRQDAPRRLAGMARHMISKILGNRPELKDVLKNFFLKSDRPGGVIRLGTLCSGTDSPAIALQHLIRSLCEEIGGLEGSKKIDHVFSCEFDEAKQGFLLKNFSDVGALFSDCTQMGRERAWDVKTKSVQDIPGDIDFLVAGFSCKDLSFMNSYRKALEEMGQSGRTLQGCFDYVERYRPRVVLLENVYAIDRADQHGLKQVNIVMEGLRLRGYVAGYTLMNSCDYYLPQIRHRIWMWGFRMDRNCDDSVKADYTRERAFQRGLEINPRMQELLKSIEEPCALHFDDLLLSEEDARVHEYNRLLYAKSRRRQEAGASGRGIRDTSAKLTWQQKYTMHRMKLDYAQERPYTAERGARWKGMLNERTMELLDLKCLDVMNEQGMDPREVPMLWDLLQSVERVPGSRVRRDRQNYATCVLPPSLLWHTVRHRFILGQEKLALQGIFEEDLADLKSFSQTLLSDLAGNAFTTTVCLACMLGACSMWEEATVKKQFTWPVWQPPLIALPAPPQAKTSDSTTAADTASRKSKNQTDGTAPTKRDVTQANRTPEVAQADAPAEVVKKRKLK